MTVTSRTACPMCRKKGKDRSGDNLVTYAEGNSYCFACGYYVGAEPSLARVKQKLRPTYKDERSINLPFDFTDSIPTEPLSWLYKYGLSSKEIKDNRIGWSESEQLLIFPVYAGNDLLMWQGRFFPARKPKYFTVGDASKILHILPSSSNYSETAVTEDIVSAIKVSRIIDAMPMWGGVLSPELALRLTSHYKKLIIWGDYDKRGDYLRMKKKYDLLFEGGCGIIISTCDPKEYQSEEIAEFVEAARYNQIGG